MSGPHLHDRELSCFFVRELLPLYLENHLDTIRTQQITQHLKTCDGCREQFTKARNVRQILEELSQAQAQASLIAYLKKEHHFWVDIFERAGWRRWPATLKWAVELSGVALALVVVIHWFPWFNFARQIHSMRAAQVAAINKTVSPTPLPPTSVAADDVAAQGDEEPRVFKTPVGDKPGQKPQKAVVVAEAEHEVVTPTASPNPAAAVAKEDESEDEGASQSADDKIAEMAASTEGERGGADGKKTGYVWRGTLKVEELNDDLAEKVTRVVNELGGVKAGQVELGWHRGGQRYYHFILPEENYEKLLSALNGEGILTLNREVHPRVIKEGHMRIIMTLEEDQ